MKPVSFLRFTGGGITEPAHWDFRALQREPQSNPNPPFVIGKPPRGPSHMHDAPGFDARCGLCCELRRLARGR
jgi:hypothetical protein